MSSNCPCGSGKKMSLCCLPLIEGQALAETPEQLMRSRYTAFFLNKMDYVRTTTDPQARLDIDFPASERWAQESEFKKLEIIESSQDGNKGRVEFKASYILKARPEELQVHHEISKFRRQAGHWYFREGKVLSET